MTLADVIPALQQGTIDASVGGIVVFTPMYFYDAAHYVTETDQPAIFVIAEVNKKWYESLQADLQKIVDDDARAQQNAIIPQARVIVEKARNGWKSQGGELIKLPLRRACEDDYNVFVGGGGSRKQKARSRGSQHDRARSHRPHPLGAVIDAATASARWSCAAGLTTAPRKRSFGAVGFARNRQAHSIRRSGGDRGHYRADSPGCS